VNDIVGTTDESADFGASYNPYSERRQNFRPPVVSVPKVKGFTSAWVILPYLSLSEGHHHEPLSSILHLFPELGTRGERTVCSNM
jgi:hypothetical protein